MMFVNRRWQQLNKGLWSSPAAVLATISGLITIVMLLAAIVHHRDEHPMAVHR
jgi:hypothetical protein